MIAWTLFFPINNVTSCEAVMISTLAPHILVGALVYLPHPHTLYMCVRVSFKNEEGKLIMTNKNCEHLA